MESKFMVAKIIFTTVFFFNILKVASQINLGFGKEWIKI